MQIIKLYDIIYLPLERRYIILQKYSLDENFFENIDTEHKAYWLGFIYADGSLSKTAPKARGKNRLQIFLSKKDICILENFKKDLCFTGPIHTNKYDNSYNKRDGVEVCYMQVNSSKLCSDLEGLGYVSNRYSIPNIPNRFVRDFIRGYFDGDGCMSVYEYDNKGPYNVYHRKAREFSITSPEEIILQFKKIFEEQCNVSKNVSIKRYKRTSKAVSLRYGGKQDVISLYHYLYDGATIYLQRKYDNFQQVLKQ